MTGTIENGKYISGKPATELQKLRFEEMLASRSPPRLKGDDRAFLEDTHNNHGFGEMLPHIQEMHVANARKAGVSIAGKVYKSGLCRPGMGGGRDPQAWVSDPSDVLKRCEEQGKDCYGHVTYTAPEAEPEPDIPLAEHLVQKYAAEVLKVDPTRDVRDVREQVIELHGCTKKRFAKSK